MSQYSYTGPKHTGLNEILPLVSAQPGTEPPPGRRCELISEAALQMLKALPADLSMARSARDFPHVVNRLAAAWSNYRAFVMLMNRLLIDDRADREGFPPPVIMELDALSHYRAEVNTRAV